MGPFGPVVLAMSVFLTITHKPDRRPGKAGPRVRVRVARPQGPILVRFEILEALPLEVPYHNWWMLN